MEYLRQIRRWIDKQHRSRKVRLGRQQAGNWCQGQRLLRRHGGFKSRIRSWREQSEYSVGLDAKAIAGRRSRSPDGLQMW